ncbi:MFS transporter [Zafaria sp. Z1313]|uniref:MFS transporter n=1 Tax=unclassified Zafaria TaxID=2828765 RepID=UPI002E79D169|nr:MFS transporter [Zafaria sp. J156]MEE1620442.1 MFS transporter [Zafaria sp. J156]
MTVINELRMRAAEQPAERGAWDAGVRTRLVLTGTVMALLLIGANLATPVYPLLQARLGLGPLAVTLAFSSYVLALIAGLVLYGHWSDHIGRRAALVLAVLGGIAGGLVFAFAPSLEALVAGRVLQGAAVALATGASSAALRELLPRHPEWAGRLTLLASAGGVAAGPVAGGLLSQFPAPTTTPFLVHSAVLAAVLAPLWLLRARPALEPAPGRAAPRVLRPRRLVLSAEARPQFWTAAVTGFLSFALFGFSLSLAPGYFAALFGIEARPATGLLAALVLAASAASQLLGTAHRRLLPAALVLMGLGTVLIALAGALASLPLLIAASLLAGAAQGAAFRAAFNDVAAAVPARQHAQVVSTVYVVTYLGSALPVLGLGLAAGIVGLPSAVAWFAGAIGAGCLATAAAVAWRRRGR